MHKCGLVYIVKYIHFLVMQSPYCFDIFVSILCLLNYHLWVLMVLMVHLVVGVGGGAGVAI
jgi:hypothetical protein